MEFFVHYFFKMTSAHCGMCWQIEFQRFKAVSRCTHVEAEYRAAHHPDMPMTCVDARRYLQKSHFGLKEDI